MDNTATHESLDVMKKSRKRLIDRYDESCKDIIVIFVTEDWNADVFWEKLCVDEMIRTLDSVSEGLMAFE